MRDREARHAVGSRSAIAWHFTHSYIRASCSLFVRARPRLAGWPERVRVRRGYCVGSPRQRLLSTTFTAAMNTIAAAPSAADIAALATTASPSAASRKSPSIFASHRHAVRSATTPQHAVRGVVSLLHHAEGRLAHDDGVARVTALHRDLRPSQLRAVKNLRITSSAVLLLNFREVRHSHFCSTTAAM